MKTYKEHLKVLVIQWYIKKNKKFNSKYLKIDKFYDKIDEKIWNINNQIKRLDELIRNKV